MRLGKLASIVIVLFTSSSFQILLAQDYYWVCGDENWNSNSCWSGTQGGAGGFGVPVLNNDAFIYNTSSTDTTVTYNSNLYSTGYLHSYVLDANNTGSLSLNLQDGQVLRSSFGTVGDYGTASVIHNSGDNITKYLDIAERQTSSGNYSLNGGRLITTNTNIAAASSEISGTGSFIQTGGTHQSQRLQLGNISSSANNIATYDLSNGTLNTTWSYLMSSKSVFNQTGGVHFAQQNVRIQNNFFTGAATYNLGGGILSTMTLLNYGVFNYTGGDLQTSGGIQNWGKFNLDLGVGESREFNGYVYNQVRGAFDVADGATAIFNGRVTGSGNFTSEGRKVFRNEYQPGSVSLPPEPIPDDPFPLPEEPVSYSLANGTSFSGDVIFEDSSMISLFLLGNGQSDWLSFSGFVELDGALNLMLGLDEYAPAIGDSWDIMVGNDINGLFSYIVSDAPANWGWDILYLDDRVTLTAIEVSTVPIPSAVWLFGSGLLGLIGIARRKANA